MSYNIELEGGKTKRLLTKGKYCDRDIMVSPENLDERLAQQDVLIEEIKTALQGKSIVGGGTVEAKLQEKDITENGIYTPDEGFDGFSKVTVNVESGTGEKPTLFTPSISLQSATLFTPSISLQSATSVLTITDDNGGFVQGYNIYANDNLITVSTSKEVTLTDYIEHTETLEIKVQAVGANFNPSAYSNVVEWIKFDESGTIGLAYSLSSDGTYAICNGIGEAVATDIEIASKYEGVAVTQIASEAFKSQTQLTSVIIPPTVLRINSDAFISCSGIKSVVIGDGVEYIGSEAFMWCKALKSIIIPDSVTAISERVFLNCSGLTNVVIGKSVTTIQKQLFANCTNLTTITIPSKVSGLGQWAFSGCSNLKRVDISTHTSIPTLGTAVFQTTHTDLQIKVPTNLIDSWKASTNWSNYATKIVTEFTNEV